jgi:hypothetical protein
MNLLLPSGSTGRPTVADRWTDLLRRIAPAYERCAFGWVVPGAAAWGAARTDQSACSSSAQNPLQ